MDFQTEGNKRNRGKNRLGTAHVNPRDAYKDVPVLKKPTWNHEIAAYFFLGGISAGAGVIGSLAEVFGGDGKKDLARVAHYVSLAALVPCPVLLIDDLGTPSRFHHMLRIFKPSSPMNLGSWALTAHGAVATLTVLSVLAREDKVPVVGGLFRLLPERGLAALGLPGSLALAGYTGVLLGTTSVPVWHTSPVLGGLFTASALGAGAAATNLVAAVTGQSHQESHDAMASVGLLMGAADLALLAGYVATSGRAAKALTTGHVGALLAGAAASGGVSTLLEAGSLLSRRKSPAVGVLASVAALMSGALLRWGVVRAGRVSYADRELTLDSMAPRKGNPGWRSQGGPDSSGARHGS